MFRTGRVCRYGTAGDDSAADEFAYAGEYEVGYVSDVDAVECCGAADGIVDGQKKKAPAHCTEKECKRTCNHRKDDELPSAGFKLLPECRPFHFTEGDP